MLKCKWLSPVVRQYIVAVIANFTYFHIGMGVGLVSPMVSKLKDENQTVLVKPLTDEEASWIVSVSFLSGILVLFFASCLSNVLGRRITLILFCIPRMIMCPVLLLASRAWLLILARVLNGVADAVMSSSTTYTSEIADKEIRGAIGVISQTMSAFGVMFMLSVGPYISYLNLQIVTTCIVFATSLPLITIPESPYFLYSKGRKEECIKVLTYLRGSTASALEEYKDYSQIKEVKVNIRELLIDRITLKTIGMVFILAIGSQAVGCNMVLLNLQSIFEVTHTNVSPKLSSLVSGCIQLLSTLCAILLTDRIGRKPLLAVSLIGLAIGMFGLGIFFKLTENVDEVIGVLNYVPLVSIMIIILCYNVGIGTLVNALMAELFEGPARAIGVAFGVFVATSIIFLGTKYFYVIVATISPATTYWIFCGFCVLICVFILFCVPETKGKPFSQIQRELGRKEMGSS